MPVSGDGNRNSKATSVALRSPQEHIDFIRRISGDHPEWGEDKIVHELQIKFGITHSTSTIRKYRVTRLSPHRGQRWRTFVMNHAHDIFSCDFLIQYTVFFHVFYIFVIMEISTRRIVHFNVSDHPTLEWVKQQLREATCDTTPRFLIHDNDGIFSQHRHTGIDENTGRKRTFRCRLDWLLIRFWAACITITGWLRRTAPPSHHLTFLSEVLL